MHILSPGAELPVNPLHTHKWERLKPGVSVTSIFNSAHWAMFQAFFTGFVSAEKHTGNAEQALVLHCLNDGYSVLAARGIYRWTDERERIAHMRYVRFLALDQFFHCPV